MIPCLARVGETTFRTAIFPKDGGYLLPVRVAVRRAESLEEGREVTVTVKPSASRKDPHPFPGGGPLLDVRQRQLVYVFSWCT